MLEEDINLRKERFNINTVNLCGRLVKDAEIRQTNKGDDVANFTVAIRRDAENTDFIDCVAFGKTAEIVRLWTEKGSLIGLEGRIQKRSYQAKTSETRYVVEVVVSKVHLIEPKKEQRKTYQTQYEENLLEKLPKHQEPEEYGVDDSDLPF